jgi:3-hydroxyacyl-CoA dehydrogenase
MKAGPKERNRKMRLSGRIGAALAIVLAAAGCNVTVNNQSAENVADTAAVGAENVANDAAKAVDRAGSVVENKADEIANGVHVDVKVDRHADKDRH